jgi:hypothetical protein
MVQQAGQPMAERTITQWIRDGAVGLLAALLAAAYIGSYAAAGIINMTLAICLLVFVFFVAVAATFWLEHLYHFSWPQRGSTLAVVAVLLSLTGWYQWTHYEAPLTEEGIANKVFERFFPQKTTAAQPRATTLPDHPPLFRSEQIEFPRKPGSKSFSIDQNTFNVPGAKSFKETSAPKNIAKADNKSPPNVLSLFQRDGAHMVSTGLTLDVNIDLHPDASTTIWLYFLLFMDFNSNSRFYSVYIPETPYKFASAIALAADPEYVIRMADTKMGFERKQGESTPKVESWRFKFTGAVYIYTEQPFVASDLEAVRLAFAAKGVTTQFRSSEYLAAMWDGAKRGQIPPIDLYEIRGTPPTIEPVLR